MLHLLRGHLSEVFLKLTHWDLLDVDLTHVLDPVDIHGTLRALDAVEINAFGGPPAANKVSHTLGVEEMTALKLDSRARVQSHLADGADIVRVGLTLGAAVRVEAFKAAKFALNTTAGASTIEVFVARLDGDGLAQLGNLPSIGLLTNPSELCLEIFFFIGSDPLDVHCLNHLVSS